MAKTQKRKEMTSLTQLSTAVCTGGLFAFAVCVLCLLFATWMIFVGRLEENMMLRVCCLGVALGSFSGGFYAARRSKCKVLLSAVGSALVQSALWLVVGVAMYHTCSPSAVGTTLVASVAGASAAGLLSAGLPTTA